MGVYTIVFASPQYSLNTQFTVTPGCSHHDPTPNEVILFEHTGYNGGGGSGGRCEVFTSDYPDLNISFVGNDTVSSIRIGANVKAVLCEHTYYVAWGRCQAFTSDNPRLGLTTIGNDTTSSVKVQPRGTVTIHPTE
jgi:hypothetical protein